MQNLYSSADASNIPVTDTLQNVSGFTASEYDEKRIAKISSKT